MAMRGVTPPVRSAIMGTMSENLIRVFTIAFVALVALPAEQSFARDPLAGMVGKNRVVLLFSRSRSDATLDRQLALLGDKRPELADRKVIVLLTPANRDTMAVIGFPSLPQGANRELTSRFAPAAQGLTVVLVGLDGNEQARWQHVVEPRIIFETIDNAPGAQEGGGTQQKPAATN
jgi:hypothetical protein